MSIEQIHKHIERLANLLRTQSRQLLADYGLQPIQLEVLRYLSVCNRYSDTVKGVTEYLGQTKGTVSQSIKVLERKGLVTKHVDSTDKRIVHLKITNNARSLLNKTVPAPLFRNADKQLKRQSANQILNALISLLRTVQKANDLKSFGVCHTCRYNQKTADGNYLCGLTKEVLSSEDIQLICKEHEDGERVFGVL
ncbi:MAG: winged helix-turn-helix transcriptional regulator [Gammaproteobacteria bacterium]|nr:winged helix-turn-helix transcriptional regulator [Gammaproteobacteria bacterium]